jgi:hypothetical protein
MPKLSITLNEKIAKEKKKLEDLMLLRHKEIVSIFNECNAITIDDSLLAGFLLFSINQVNKDNKILQEFILLAKTNNIPSKSRKTPIK